MERLTERDEFGNTDIIGVDSEDLQLNLDVKAFNRVTTALNRFAAYEDAIPVADLPRAAELHKADLEGLLVALPCKVGDTIYAIPSETNFRLNAMYRPENNRVYEQTVNSIRWFSNSRYMIWTCDGICSELSEGFGVTWFLTRAEAEAALKEENDGT